MEKNIRKNLLYLIDKLSNIDRILLFLEQEGILSKDECELIGIEKTSLRQKYKILDSVKMKDLDGVGATFLEILRKTSNAHCADKILGIVPQNPVDMEQEIWENLVCTLTNNPLLQAKMISSKCYSILWKNDDRIMDNVLFRVGSVGLQNQSTNSTLVQNEGICKAAMDLLDNLEFQNIKEIFINTKDFTDQWSEVIVDILELYREQIEHLCITNVQWNNFQKMECHLDFTNLKSFIFKTDCEKIETPDILNKMILVKGSDSQIRKFWKMNSRIEIWNKSRPIFVLDPECKLVYVYSFSSCLPEILEECVDQEEVGYQLDRLFYFTPSPTTNINLNKVNKINLSHLFIFLSEIEIGELIKLVESILKFPSLQKLALSTKGIQKGWHFDLDQMKFLTNLRFLYLGEAHLYCSQLFDWNAKLTKIVLATCHPQDGVPGISNCKLTFSEKIVSFERIPQTKIFRWRDASMESFDTIINEFNS